MIVCVEGSFNGEMRESKDYGIGFHLCSDPNVKKICVGVEKIAHGNLSRSLLLAKECIEANVNNFGLQYGVYMGGSHLAIFKGLTGNPGTPKIAMLLESRDLSNQYSFPDVKIFDDQLNAYYNALKNKIYAVVSMQTTTGVVKEIIEFNSNIASIEEAKDFFDYNNRPHATKKLKGGIYALEFFFESKDLSVHSQDFICDNEPYHSGPFKSIMYKVE